jgi:hypothetical protein
MHLIKDKSILINNPQKYTLHQYIIKLAMVMGFSWLCFLTLGSSQNPVSSYVWSSVAFLLITIFSAIILLGGTRWVWFFVLAYLVKLAIGLAHYLYFIDPNYFQAGFYEPLTSEYQAVYDQIITSANDKLRQGLLYYQHIEGGVSHQQILGFISVPFVYFGDFVLTISPINAFSSLLLSMNIVLLSVYKFQHSQKTTKQIAIISAYFPLTLISSLLFRDLVGLSLMSVGLTIIFLSKTAFTRFFMLAVASYLFFLQRTSYPIVLIFAFILNSIFSQNFLSKKRDSFFKITTVLLSVILLPVVFDFADTEANQRMAQAGLEVDPIFLPLKIILGIIGPFPWNNFLLFEIIPANAYQLQDYLQGTMNVAILITVFTNKKSLFKRESLNLLTVTGFLLIIVGLLSPLMHSTYVSIGFIFWIPALLAKVPLKGFLKTYLFAFISLLILNAIVIVLFGNLGLSSLWF